MASTITFSHESPFVKPTNWTRVEELCDLQRINSNLLCSATIDIVKTYKTCKSDFRTIETLPQRVLTNPSEPVNNNGFDNAEGNLICRVHDKMTYGDKVFTILDLLGTGTFGQVFRCKQENTKELVAVKVIKNKPAYHTQGALEVKIARLLNNNYDPHNEKHIVRLLESFEYHGHICLVFELLSMSVLDLLTQNQFRGLPLSVVQRFTKQLLQALTVLEDANIIHCDLKPENILIEPHNNKKHLPKTSNVKKSEENSSDTIPEHTSRRPGSSGISDIKVIDFGSACFEGRTVYSYIQSRFYRSPEVLLGAPYTGAIDMWSLACVCAEMFLGLPLFPGISQHNQLSRIVEMFGAPPDFIIESKNANKYFTANEKSNENDDSASNKSHTANFSGSNSTKYRIKTAEEYAADTNTEVPVLKKYLRYNTLEEVILKCSLPNKSKLTPEQKSLEMMRRKCFVDFLYGLFKLNPFERWTARQASEHPFIKNIPFNETFTPSSDLKIQERKLMFMVQLQHRHGTSSHHHDENKQQNVAIKGLRAPTNFGSNLSGAQANFTPLQYAHRRLSEPVDSATMQTKLKAFDSNERPMLRRGDPVHAKQPAETNVESSQPAATVKEETNKETVKEHVYMKKDHAPAVTAPIEITQQAASSVTTQDSGNGGSSTYVESPSNRSQPSSYKSDDMKQRMENNVNKNTAVKHSPNNKPRPRGSFTRPDNAPSYQTYAPQENENWMMQQQQQMPPSIAYPPQMPNTQYIPIPPQHQFIPPFPVTPPSWPANVPPPLPMIPAGMMPPPPMPYFGSMDANAQAMMYPYNPAMASSFGGPSSYGAFAVGSMQDGNPMAMNSFGSKLHRPDADEQRRFLSQTSPGLQYWPQSPANYPTPQYNPEMMPPPMPNYPPGAMPYGMPPMPIAQSYDSRMLNRAPIHNMGRPPVQSQQQQQRREYSNNNNGNNNNRYLQVPQRREGEGGSDHPQPSPTTSEPKTPPKVPTGNTTEGSKDKKPSGGRKPGDSAATAEAEWDPFFDGADD